MQSIWSDTRQMQHHNCLANDKKTDVLIIGGGMAGVLTAYFLDQAGVDYILVEKTSIGNGITKNTSAKITSQHGLIYDQMLKNIGQEKAKLYLDANNLAVKTYKQLCTTIPCDFEEQPAFTYTLTDRKKIEKEVTAVNFLGGHATLVEELPLALPTLSAIKFDHQGQFHPLKFLDGITKNLNIFEHTAITKLDGHVAMTTHGNITANKIIVATHFPFLNKHGSYFLKMYQHRSYIIALKGAPNVHGMYLDEAKNGMSFRNYNDLLFIGGGDHKTGKTGGNFQELRAFAQANSPSAIEVASWATQDCMSLDGIPYIGQYSKRTPDLYVATGFNKWGMSSSMVSAMILTDMILGKENIFSKVFSPSRSILKPQLAVNGLSACANLLTPTTKRCPHLGCALKWNKVEHTWDCPCHGSRFEEDGKLIDNPATHSLKNK